MTHLHLNIFPLRIPDVEVEVGVLPFDSKDSLRNLRDRYRASHVFKRVRVGDEDLIYSIPLDGKPYPIASRHSDIGLRENLGVARALLNESLIASYARTPHRPIIDVDPLKIGSSEPEHDFLARAAAGVAVPPWLIVRLAHSIDPRVFEFESKEPFLGVVFDQRSYRRIARPCSEWLSEGFDLTGLYVSEKVAFHDTRIQPRLRLVGKVFKVDGTKLLLSDYREGRDVVEAADVQIDAGYEGFTRCLATVFPGKAKRIDRDLFKSCLRRVLDLENWRNCPEWKAN